MKVMSVFADKFQGTDTGKKIMAAIASLPDCGGIVDASRIQKSKLNGEPEIDIHETIFIDKPIRLLLGAVDYTTSANPVFEVSANFSMIGVDRKATSLLTKNKGKIFELSGTWPGNGTGLPYFGIERMCLIGNGKSCIFDTTSNVVFNEGTIRIENNVIKNFKAVALTFGKSIYYGLIINNYFDNNYGSLYFEYGCDSHVINNKFLQDSLPTAGPQIVVVAPNVRICGNDFFGSDNSSQPDILLKPIGSSTDGGWVWIVDNKFAAERETFDPSRSRIAVTNLPKGYPVRPFIPEFKPLFLVSGPSTIRGNHFLGPGVLFILSISRENKKVTVVTEPRHGIPVDGVAIFKISLNDDPQSINKPRSFNGTFTTTATNGMSFTYLQEKSNAEIFSKVGYVTLSNGKELVISSISRVNKWVTLITKIPHDIPISATDKINVAIPNNFTFSGGPFEATSINEMCFGYEQKKDYSDEKRSSPIGIATPANGRAILLDYNIDSWDISHNLFYHYGIIVDDEMATIFPNDLGPSIFRDNRIIPHKGMEYKILKNDKIVFG